MPVTQKYAIDPDFKDFPVINIRFNRPVIALLNAMIRLTRLFRRRSPDVTVTKKTIAGKGGHSIKIKIIRPANAAAEAPALIYYHGGGFAMSFASLHLQSAEHYAHHTGCVVVFVCYRLAMRHPFPAGFDDAYSGLDWTVEHAVELGIDRKRIAVGGDSAGGALAAGVAQKCRDEQRVALCGQLLIYPVLDHRCTTVSATEFVDVPLWNALSNRRMWTMYLRLCDPQSPPPYAAPGLGDAGNLPPTYIETAEFDPLRDEALQYGEALSANGNPPDMNNTIGTIHGYDSVATSPIAVDSMARRVDFLHAVFSPQTRYEEG